MITKLDTLWLIAALTWILSDVWPMAVVCVAVSALYEHLPNWMRHDKRTGSSGWRR